MTDKNSVQNFAEFSYQLGYKDGFEAAQPKWISVKERLPEDGQTILAYTRCFYAILQWDAIEGIWLNDTGWNETKSVTYWMPLPKPPKEAIE